MITDFFGKKRGRKRKVFSKLPKNKSLHGLSRKTKSIILQDGGEVCTPIIVKVRKNVDGEWSCTIENTVIDLAANSTDNDSLSLSSGDVDIVEPLVNNERNVMLTAAKAPTTSLSRKNVFSGIFPNIFQFLLRQ